VSGAVHADESKPAFVLSPAAADDISEIWEFIADDSIDAADRVVDELYEAMQQLAIRPGMGQVRTELSPAPVRFWPIYSYLIAYQPGDGPLQIVRVLSGYRNIAVEMGGA
jgi:plasmid stabilization system protein ParE